ncbi:protein DEPP1 [Leptodactylus fuscus]
MRSQLLISVQQLPTISEDKEVKTHNDRMAADNHVDSGLEDYVKSIQTLAQPCSTITDHLQLRPSKCQRRTRFRQRSSLKVCESKVLAVAQESSCSTSLISLQSHADPIAWLFRQSGKENQELEKPYAATRHTLPSNLRLSNVLKGNKATDTPSRTQSSEGQTMHDRKNRLPRLQKKCCSPSYNTRGRTSKLHKPQLPVIYEL